MEEIKTNLDKMMAQFNDSITHSAPKKLNFGMLGDSLNDSGTYPKRSRLASNLEESNMNNSDNGSTSSLNSSTTKIPPSPWEVRRLKIDLIEAEVRLAKLKEEADRQHKLQTQKDTLHEHQITELKKQCEFSSNKVLDLEKHMQLLRKREYASKQELHKTQKDLHQQKLSYEDTVHKLQRQNKELEENSQLIQRSLTQELDEYRMLADKLQIDLGLVNDELTFAQKQLGEFKQRALAYDELSGKYENQKQDLEEARIRIKLLENDIASYEDWKEITKNSKERLISLPDKENEIERLKENNKNLHNLLGNKLLLEEQVHSMREQVDKSENAKAEAVTLQVKLTHIEQELKEWVKIAQDHCLPNMLVSPLALRSRIEQLLQNDIVMTSEKKSKLRETKCIDSQLFEYKQKCEIFAKNLEELNVALKRHKIIKERLQKKIVLISKERNCLKELLENYEKDLTISHAVTTDSSNPEMHLRYRLDMVEKTLMGYKEMCANLEKELNSRQTNGDGMAIVESSSISENGYDHIKKELDTLRMENDRLRRRKEELELELEHRCLKGDFDVNKCKVIHFVKNPAADAYEKSENLIEKLQAEIERLKRRNQKLLEDQEITQARLNETVGLTMNMKELNQLRAELESSNSKMKAMKEIYKSASMEFRDVCYMLFGYKVDRMGQNSHYKILSMYAESPEDCLHFELNESNALNLLETPYTTSLQSLIDSQLGGHKSLPVFLSSLTLELFQRTTQTMS